MIAINLMQPVPMPFLTAPAPRPTLTIEALTRLVRPGDVLCYGSDGSLIDWIISVKTWSDVVHVEVVSEAGIAATARSCGVDRFALRTEGLIYVLRAWQPFDSDTANRWLETAIGQKYDWIGLILSFYARYAGRNNNRMFCSELVTRFLRAGGLHPFADDYDADMVSPGMYAASPLFYVVWSGRCRR